MLRVPWCASRASNRRHFHHSLYNSSRPWLNLWGSSLSFAGSLAISHLFSGLPPGVSLSLASLSGPVPLLFSLALRFCVTQPRPLLRLCPPLLQSLTTSLGSPPQSLFVSRVSLWTRASPLLSRAKVMCNIPDRCSDCAPHGSYQAFTPVL
jgi:hypothetical protein